MRALCRRAASLSMIVPVLTLPVLAGAQDAATFGQVPIEVVSEWHGQDRGDGSGSYDLATTVTDPASGVAIEHELASERTAEGEVTSTEGLRVLEGDHERFRSDGDPSALGPWAGAATIWAIPFDLEFRPDPRTNYRPQGKRVAEIVQSIVADAKVASKSGSDGRTSATIEIPGVSPVNILAEQFVGIRKALRGADIGLARLVIEGMASAPTAPPAESAETETPETESPETSETSGTSD